MLLLLVTGYGIATASASTLRQQEEAADHIMGQ